MPCIVFKLCSGQKRDGQTDGRVNHYILNIIKILNNVSFLLMVTRKSPSWGKIFLERKWNYVKQNKSMWNHICRGYAFCCWTIHLVASIIFLSLIIISRSFSSSSRFEHSTMNLLCMRRARPRICMSAVTVVGGYMEMTRSHSGQSTPSSATDVATTT